MKTLVLKPRHLTLSLLRAVTFDQVQIQLDPSCKDKMDASTETVRAVLRDGRTVYGINTGFGRLAQTRIDDAQLEELQSNLVLSHCTGMGPLLNDEAVRLILALKVTSLAQGFSGIRQEVLDYLIAFYNEGLYPCIPSKGSVGASGDLAPLAHMSAPIIGSGKVRYKGEILPATEGLAKIGLKPMVLGPKEGLALLNGTQVSTALALLGLFRTENLMTAATLAGALSVEAAKGSHVPFDPRIQEARGQVGQTDIAAVFRDILSNSPIKQSHADCDKVQDPYSLRCQPQVLGACLDHMRFAATIFEREANAVSDNPLVFSLEGDILSGGNFHAEPIAMASDVLALAIAEIGALSERRIALLMDSSMSGLPPFLVAGSGLNSGFMIAQVTAAALASENKSLAHPACVDSLPTSANQEDHVSMATFAARRLSDMALNTAGVLAVELLSAAQGIDFHKPLKTSAVLEGVMARIRADVPFFEKDRYFSGDLELASDLIWNGELNGLTKVDYLPSLTS
ncbi:histidine ammonia-lyase [Kiloniella laminariae]|uniref:Histidine ammonia-lyase n=1 Tax=Kiloniella laminariae TaxID=454162 RepID=A0ABT4LLD0_9PROT|nr:histidine ammonia-lyase [Kiloniella laminariae]MCZ4281913.1 histidine ammonia-lyase [Kiloniella laminariae]